MFTGFVTRAFALRGFIISITLLSPTVTDAASDQIYKLYDTITQSFVLRTPDSCCLCAQVVGRGASGLLSAHYRVDSHPHINSLHEVLLGEQFLYLVFPPAHGDLHSHVRLRKRLREPEARRLFKQIAETVRVCHEQGIVLRDLKLRKFVFADPHR